MLDVPLHLSDGFVYHLLVVFPLLRIEMEGAGFAAACSALRIPWLVVRGIADYGDQDVSIAADGSEVKRGKSWQFPSTYVAAAYIRDMVITGRVPLVENARSRPS